MMFVTYDLS